MPDLSQTASPGATDSIINPRRIAAQEHGIDRNDVGANAVKVIKTLINAGFKAYLVGGGIRDLLLGMHPKDFDISTDARPEQVVQLFRKARIIGRRFKIAHVYFGREVIEVTTFRGHHPESEDEHPHAVRSKTGQLLRDNIYGSEAEDAIRRDFTINSLYYDIEQNTVLDYTGGFEDIEKRIIRVIGDPGQRYREDPVRMLRAIRFAGKLGFTIESGSADPIVKLADLLNHIPAARLFDESLKLFLSGYGEQTFDLMQQYQLFEHLFPETAKLLTHKQYQRLITLALKNTDTRIAQKKGTTPAFFFAVVLWPPLLALFHKSREAGEPEMAAMHRAEQKVIAQQVNHTSIPRRFSIPMRDIWNLQFRLTRRGGQRAAKLSHHPRFRAAYDFLLLREQSGDPTTEQNPGLGQWWTDYQEAGTAQRKKMVAALGDKRPGRRRKRKPHKPQTQH